jgi:hypothetical protein
MLFGFFNEVMDNLLLSRLHSSIPQNNNFLSGLLISQSIDGGCQMVALTNLLFQPANYRT